MLYRSTILGQASGSLAGTTFSRNKGGQYTRSRAVPTNPNSPAQQNIRAWFAAAAGGWRQLTSGEQGAWAAYAASTPVTNALGDSVHNSGFNWYLATTVLRSSIAGAYTNVADAPATPGLLSDTPTALAISVATGATITSTGTAGDAALIRVGPVLSAGVNSSAGPLSILSETGADPSAAIALDRATFPYGSMVAADRRVTETVLFDLSTRKMSSKLLTIVTVAA